MELLYNKCRICLENKNSLMSVYNFEQNKYLPSLIYNISGVKIIRRLEPTAKICFNCKDAVIIAETIILRCQESEELLQYEMLNETEQQDMNLSKESIEQELHFSEAEVCEQSFCEDEIKEPCQTDEELLKHLKENEEIQFKCELCSFSSPTTNNLMKHIINVHQIQRKTNVYNCKLCAELKFSQKSSLYRHMQTFHNILPDEKKFHCNKCGRSYIKEKHLREHKMQKHEPRRFKCVAPNCQQSFTRAFTLRRHFLNAHQSQTRLFCAGNDCNQQFKIYDHWNYHNKIVHNNKATCYSKDITTD